MSGDAVQPFERFEGEVEAPYRGTDDEILSDLLAVIDAVELKPVRLTKSGIPPKPLWTAINHRLIWKDPSGILYDWEEADQVRFVYRLALGLDLIRPDDELSLTAGPTAGPFFLAGSLERARMLQRAYLALWDWDERCDARNEQGHRFNFGQAFRRDFVHDVTTVREAAIDLLSRMPSGWTDLTHLARALSDSRPRLLISEACSLPELPEDGPDAGIDPEKLRFLRYWFTLLGRFGWADLGRTGQDGDTRRICRLTPLGARLFKGSAHKESVSPQIHITESLDLEAVGDEMSPRARFITRMLGEQVDTPRGKPPRYRISPQSVELAAKRRFDLEAIISWLEQWGETGAPEPLKALVEQALSARSQVRIVRSALAIELDQSDVRAAKTLAKAGFSLERGLALAAGRDVPGLFEAVGGEPDEGFDYPPDEPLAIWAKKGVVLQLYYDELPLLHRELLLMMTPAGDPPAVTFTADKVAGLAKAGWTSASLLSALEALTLKPAPPRIADELSAMFS